MACIHGNHVYPGVWLLGRNTVSRGRIPKKIKVATLSYGYYVYYDPQCAASYVQIPIWTFNSQYFLVINQLHTVQFVEHSCLSHRHSQRLLFRFFPVTALSIASSDAHNIKYLAVSHILFILQAYLQRLPHSAHQSHPLF